MYVKNTITGVVKKGNLGDAFLKEEYEDITGTQEADDFDLQEAQEHKKEEAKLFRQEALGHLLLVSNIDESTSYYAKTTPNKNLFQSALLIDDSQTRSWGCYPLTLEEVDGVNKGEFRLTDSLKEEVELTKADLLSLAGHYESRQNEEHVQCDRKRKAVDSLLTIAAVEAFDITQLII